MKALISENARRILNDREASKQLMDIITSHNDQGKVTLSDGTVMELCSSTLPVADEPEIEPMRIGILEKDFKYMKQMIDDALSPNVSFSENLDDEANIATMKEEIISKRRVALKVLRSVLNKYEI